MKDRKERNLTEAEKEEKFRKLVDWAYRKAYGVEKIDSWESKFNKADILTNIIEKETNEGINYRIKDTINRALKS